MSLLLIAPHDGTVRWQRGIMNNWPGPLHGTPVSFKLSDTKTEVRSWTGSISFSFFFFFFCCLTLYLPLFLLSAGERPGEEKKKLTDSLKTWRVHACSFLSFLSRWLLPARKASRERRKQKKELGRTGQAFQSAFCCLPVGPSWSSVPAKFLLYSAEVASRTLLI